MRLYQGDYGQETDFGEDPVAIARSWQEQGAARLHVVDLDGARSGERVNGTLITRLVQSVTIPVQVGGGLRTQAGIDEMLHAGAARVVLGTAALQDPDLLLGCLRDWSAESIVVSIDARDGRVATDGWLKQSQVSALDLAQRLRSIGVRRILYTDISRDGTLAGPNVAGVERMVRGSGLAVIASGGVTHVKDALALKQAGAEAVVVGRSLYTGALSLQATLDAVAS